MDDEPEILRAENRMLREGNERLALQLLVQVELLRGYRARVEELELLIEDQASQEPLV